MTDLITRARKEWCESHPAARTAFRPCPPEVVAALLDVLESDDYGDYCMVCGEHRIEHAPGCKLSAAKAAITRALEGK